MSWRQKTGVTTTDIPVQQPSRLVQFLLNDNIIRLPGVMKKVGLAKSTIYLRVAQGRFPKPINLGGSAVGWLTSEVDSWLSGCIAQARNGTERAAA